LQVKVPPPLGAPYLMFLIDQHKRGEKDELDANTQGEKGEGDGFGIAARETYTLLELAELFGGEIEMLPPTPTTRSEAGAVDTQAIEALGWTQKHRLPEYVASCITP